METSDILSISISILSTVISIYALITSIKASNKTAKIEASNKMSEIHEKTRIGRIIMEDIFQQWKKDEKRELSPEVLRKEVNNKDKQSFIIYYNNNYHTKLSDSRERQKSDEIHIYLHELHNLWNRYLNEEFSEEEIMTRFAPAIKMDHDLIMLYLEAHWQEHGEMNKDIKDRFWNNVPVIVERGINWRNQT